MSATSFLSVCWPLSLWLEVWLMLWWPEPAIYIQESLPFTLWLSLPCQMWGLLPSCCRGTQICFLAVSNLQCEVGGIGVLPVRGKPLSISPLEMFNCGCALLCHVSPIVWALKLHCCWHSSQPHVNYGYTNNWPWCLSDIVFTRPPA